MVDGLTAIIAIIKKTIKGDNMTDYNEYKTHGGLVWSRYNNSVCGWKPDDPDTVVLESYNLRSENEKHRIDHGVLHDGYNSTVITIFEGTRKKCLSKLDKIADERIDPKMLCYA